jgi:hypothetical protein
VLENPAAFRPGQAGHRAEHFQGPAPHFLHARPRFPRLPDAQLPALLRVESSRWVLAQVWFMPGSASHSTGGAPSSA